MVVSRFVPRRSAWKQNPRKYANGVFHVFLLRNADIILTVVISPFLIFIFFNIFKRIGILDIELFYILTVKDILAGIITGISILVSKLIFKLINKYIL